MTTDAADSEFKLALVALVIGFVSYPILYDVPLTMSPVVIGRLIGGGLAIAVVVFLALGLIRIVVSLVGLAIHRIATRGRP